MMENIYKILCQFENLLKREYSDPEPNTSPISHSSEASIIVNRNENRADLWLHPTGAGDLIIGFTDDIDSNKFAMRISADDTLILSASNFYANYKGTIYGFWDSGDATSKCMVTEFYK
jgi:hypothetical protein